MKISAKGRYALRLMLDLAEHNTGEYITLKDISDRQEISMKYLEQIITPLSKAGFLRSVRGPQGGYRLVMEPKEYKVGDILRATEGKLAPVACLEQEPNECSRCEYCATISFWQGLFDVINEYVDSVTLEDLLEQQKYRIGNDYMI